MRMADAIQLFENAYFNGVVCGETTLPRPMVVTARCPDEPPKKYFVEGGVCGFAWVKFYYRDKQTHEFCKLVMQAQEEHRIPAHESILDYSKADGVGYPACWTLWIHDFGQSMARKESFASAFALHVRKAGIPCFTGSRMD
jgi:hypothetical protein